MTNLEKNFVNLAEAIKGLKAQVSSLTKERDKWEKSSKYFQKLRREDQRANQEVLKLVSQKSAEIRDLNSQLSNREEEIEELKKQSNERYVFKEDGFDNYEFVDFLDFKKERAKHIKRFFKWENEVFQAITYGAERWVYYTFDGQDCHFYWNRQEALASLKSKGEA
jgi:cell division septum initiation protein DivIVA